MTKKHELSEQEYRIYKKQHDYDDVEEAEQGKIRREQAGSQKQRRESEARLRQQLRAITRPVSEGEDGGDPALDVAAPESDTAAEADDAEAAAEAAAERLRRNARTHKRRLVGLRKHENPEDD